LLPFKPDPRIGATIRVYSYAEAEPFVHDVLKRLMCNRLYPLITGQYFMKASPAAAPVITSSFLPRSEPARRAQALVPGGDCFVEHFGRYARLLSAAGRGFCSPQVARLTAGKSPQP